MNIHMNHLCRLHWWGEKIYGFDDSGNYFLFTEEEIYLLSHITQNPRVEDLVTALVGELEIEEKYITSFIHTFLSNYPQLFSCPNKTNERDIEISGVQGAFFPVELHISLTDSCPQHCKHCYKNAEAVGKFIDTDSLYVLLDYLQGHTPTLCLSGGEPTWHPKFSEILRRYQDSYTISVMSSGYQISSQALDVIADAKCTLNISIYSSDPQIHDEFTGVLNSYNEIMKTIEYAQKKGIHVCITTLFLNDNVEDIEKLIDSLYYKGIKTITIGTIAPLGRAKENDIKSKKISEKTYKKLLQIKEDYPFVDIPSPENTEAKNSIRVQGSPFKCSAGSFSWAVFEDGKIYPCAMCAEKELLAGSICGVKEISPFDLSAYYDRISVTSCIKKLLKDTCSCPFDS